MSKQIPPLIRPIALRQAAATIKPLVVGRTYMIVHAVPGSAEKPHTSECVELNISRLIAIRRIIEQRRTVRRDRDHRGFDRFVTSRGAASARGGSACAMLEQPQAARHRAPFVPRRAQHLPAGEAPRHDQRFGSVLFGAFVFVAVSRSNRLIQRDQFFAQPRDELDRDGSG